MFRQHKELCSAGKTHKLKNSPVNVQIDIGGSFVKATIIDPENNKVISSEYYPKTEMNIVAPRKGWAEQNPQIWWEYFKILLGTMFSLSDIDAKRIGYIHCPHFCNGCICTCLVNR